MSIDNSPPRLPAVATLNALPASDFGTAVRPLFEAAGPLAEALAAGRPYLSYADLIQRAESMAMNLPLAAQIEVLNAHPRIGEQAAIVRHQSSLSYREQGYDQEAGLSVAETERVSGELAELNRAYEDRFGFRFVVFVNKRPKSEIAEVLRRRLENPPPAELKTGLQEIFAIARDRSQQLSARE